MALLDDIETRLTVAGLVNGGTGWPLYVSALPPTPGRAVAIYATGGETPRVRQEADRPGFQVRVRGDKADYAAAEAKITEIREDLHGATGAIGEGYYSWIVATSSPASLGYDANQQPSLVCTFDSQRGR